MTDSIGRFDTGVDASIAVLPGRPDFWSYSALKEVETCPRQYALTRAEYPELWGRRGYPALPVIPAMFGDIVHGALETIVKAFVAAGCESSQSAAAVAVLKKLGGYTSVVEQTLETRLLRLDGNPRITPERRRRIARELEGRVAEARVQVQAYVSRAELLSSSDTSAKSARSAGGTSNSSTGRRPVGLGVHPEVTLADEELRLTGRVDLLTVGDDRVEILDFKTGAEDPGHLDQLRLYALLWDLDRAVNPDRRPATELNAAYPSHNVVVTAPDQFALRQIEKSLRDRIAAADAATDANPPVARPSIEYCGLCEVRSVCDAYWSSAVPDPASVADGMWFDYEGTVGPQNGSRSWWMLQAGTGRRQFLLRTTPTAMELSTGSRLRILGLRLDNDPEVDATVAVMSASSEVFRLR